MGYTCTRSIPHVYEPWTWVAQICNCLYIYCCPPPHCCPTPHTLLSHPSTLLPHPHIAAPPPHIAAPPPPHCCPAPHTLLPRPIHVLAAHLLYTWQCTRICSLQSCQPYILQIIHMLKIAMKTCSTMEVSSNEVFKSTSLIRVHMQVVAMVTRLPLSHAHVLWSSAVTQVVGVVVVGHLTNLDKVAGLNK